MNRKQSHQEIACEIFMNTNRSYYFIFANQDEKSQILKLIQNDFTFTKSDNLDPSKFHFFYELRKINNSIVQVLPASEICEKLKLSELWQKYKFSNFEYLFYLNLLSGRSFNDLSQYPVYPWVIKDYESEKISLANEKFFRDLSKPIGALNSKRIKDLTELYKDFPIEEEKCLYRSFYSTMASVSSFMIRTEPFTSSHIQLQEGRFDVAGRLFHSILMEWKAVTSEENDFRELIPEFFCFPDFLTNDNKFDLGQRMKSDGSFEKVDDVILPKWCKTTRQFIFTNREALESDYVSQNLNNWIDLIFGVYRNSFEKQNVFHPLCYPENNSQVNDRLRNHCLNFGVCPDQLFFENHPKRNQKIENLTDVTFTNSFDTPITCIMKNFIFLQGNLYIDARNIFTKSEKNMSLPKRIPGNYGDVICCSKYFGIVVFKRPFDDFVTAVELEKEAVRRISHEGNGVTCCIICGGKYMITGGNDCSLVIWNLPNFSSLRTSMIHGSPIVAVGGNSDLGIVASLDKQGLFILETLVNGRFLCSTNVLIGQSKPSILIFKSGLILLAVCNYHSTVLNLFDTKLQEICNLELSGCASDVTKITDDRGCEFIAMVIEKAIIVIEAYSLKLLLTIPTEFQSPHVGSVRKQRLLLVGDGRDFRTVMF
ncbi:Beige/BEACH domain containing protein [Trichomonas vaginalis G3]|uniref:Beige/BEACH domain containing protein n=1 Tax=Trichomonas vaginalis (strain ATCC PRA-98 / G3) TaxID=412133 RepID=A2FBF7_TRIV3|nr:beige/BEACH-related family [Trichomonas vaginalis G3]EAX97744.1 Beige/BEACH domain containing protein [Trichomonas vaginalis G3]KAI5491181.1 beige/BEACH-related family [Trichomonas vaginalis G3]|eukprot:XP_001310674.1 Beige/BEACH domain containing protein [Trichomonas vaginalis G3]